MAREPDLAILYEHESWFAPLFAVLDRRGVAWTAIRAADHRFDPAKRAPPAPVIFNRIAMSAFLRDAEHPIFYAQALFDHWQGAGARVVNGLEALQVDASKARQLSLIARLGFLAPASRVVHRRADLFAAAAELRFPVLVKADIGGTGAGIVKYETPDDLAAAAREGSTPVGVNGVAVVQEYAPRQGGKITRIETLAGRFLYAIDVTAEAETFDLCPADACAIGRPPVAITQAEVPESLIAAAEAIAKAARLDVGGIEYLIDERDGSARFYDINALSNFVAGPLEVLGWDPHERLADFLQDVIKETEARS
ncbi:MAG: alpha-L-glutamate ligase [Caulobacteraceae bacterium]